jgi:hypothetical protein
LALTTANIVPQKCAGFVVASNELLQFATVAAVNLFDTALRDAITIACNSKFLGDLVGMTTPIASTGGGGTADAIGADLKNLLEQIDIGENSRLFYVVSGDAAKAIACWPVQFPKFSLAGGGEVLAGVSTIISNALPSQTSLMVDASALLAADDGITLDGSRQASLQMESAPAGETASTILLSLYQRNLQALRAERTFAYSIGRANAVASLSGVNY